MRLARKEIVHTLCLSGSSKYETGSSKFYQIPQATVNDRGLKLLQALCCVLKLSLEALVRLLQQHVLGNRCLKKVSRLTRE